MQNLKNKRVAVYARFSSQMQRETSIDDQLRRCEEYVSRCGGTVDKQYIFFDAAVSGASINRPGFEKLMHLVDAHPPLVDVIVTEDMSRISRDFADAARIFQKLRYENVPLIGVADGIDTSEQGAKVTFTFKSLMHDMYLDDLRDKTLRGLEGRARRGYSTGGLPLGYRSVPVKDEDARIIGHRVEIDEAGAAIVRRVFQLYLDGRSLEAITRQFNAEHVPPARAKTRHRRKGWVSNSVANILRNEAYIGTWTYKRRQWRKIPGTNTRRPRAYPASEQIVNEYKDRIIIDAKTWAAAQTRLADVRACYVKTPGRKPGVSGRQNSYPLSGILCCGVCGAPMTIHAGTSARYYRCVDAKKRGTCKNNLSLREDVAKRRLLDAIEARYSKPQAILHLRQRVAAKLGELSRVANADLVERRARLEEIEHQIARLVHFISKGDESDGVRKALRELEASAKSERAAINTVVNLAAKPIELPSPDPVLHKVIAFRRVMESDPVRAREQLRRLFEQGRLLLEPQPEGHYIARSKSFPLALCSFAEEEKEPDHKRMSLWSRDSCAGSQLDFPDGRVRGVCEVWVPFEAITYVGNARSSHSGEAP